MCLYKSSYFKCFKHLRYNFLGYLAAIDFMNVLLKLPGNFVNYISCVAFHFDQVKQRFSLFMCDAQLLTK